MTAYLRNTYNEKRQALRELFAAKVGKGKAAQQIVNPLAPVASLTPGKILASLRAQCDNVIGRSGNALNKDRIMLLYYFHLGERRSEVFRLAWEDVDFRNSRIRLFTKKRLNGSIQYDWLPMTGELADALRWWWDNRTFKDSTHVFICEQDGGFCQEQYGKPFKERMQLMKRLCKRAGVNFRLPRNQTPDRQYPL